MSQSSLKPQIDIFCRVIDNFGDAGVLWRLARELKSFGHSVRLIIDDKKTLAPLAGLPQNTSINQYEEKFGIKVIHWETQWKKGPIPLEPSEVVIEGFACQLPEEFEIKMSLQSPPPLWINVDYFSAEDWIEDYHMMPSVHPTLGLKKLFYFPGVTKASGGLTVENDYNERQRQWEEQHPRSSILKILFFGYPYAPLKMLAEAFSQLPMPIELHLTATEASRQLRQIMQEMNTPHIRLIDLPFVDQEHFDELLWQCDVAFVRGEDSAARAMIAGRPMIWQIYAQEEEAHLIKLEALAQRIKGSFSNNELFRTWASFQREYNQGIVDSQKFIKLIESYNFWFTAAQRWSETLKRNGSLAKKISDLSMQSEKFPKNE